MAIDWTELTEGYDRIYHTSFKSDAKLLTALLRDKSPFQISEILGVSTYALYRRLDFLEIKRSHQRGGANNTLTDKRDLFLSIPEDEIAKMTAREIINKVGISSQYYYMLMKKYKRSYKLLKKRKK